MRLLRRLPLGSLLALGGCIPVAVAGASQGISYTFTQAAYRSFTNPRTQVHSAAVQALAKMQIEKTKDEKIDDAVKIEAKTKELTIHLKLTTITPKVTKVVVNAKKNFFVKDKTVAVEILMQMERILGAR